MGTEMCVPDSGVFRASDRACLYPLMIDSSELRRIARARLKDADVLRRSRRYDGSVYLCGYAVELALKARICKTLKWASFPSTRKEFQRYSSFRTHDLETLLHLSGREAAVKLKHLAEWSTVVVWEPGVRYRAVGTASFSDARDIVQSAKVLLGAL